MGSADDSFVSISLDGKECEICLQDTGDDLSTCQVCARFLTDGPIHEGFNQLPELIHTDTLAHQACFRKFHKLARRLSRSRVKTGDSKDSLWLNFNSNNLGSELLLENIRNRVSRSTPGSRSGSPQFAGGGSIMTLRDDAKSQSEPKVDSSAHQLHRCYTKYLFGENHEENNKVPKSQPAERDVCVSKKKVPTQRSTCIYNDTDASLTESLSKSEPQLALLESSTDRSVCKLEDNAQNSCQSHHDNQYLTEMKSLSIKDQCNTRHASQAESISEQRNLRTSNENKENKNSTESESACCHGNYELRMKETTEKVDPSSDIKERWRRVEHLEKDYLPKMSLSELRSHTKKLQSAVNDACAQLVQCLQEKDDLSSEVSSRHVTIKKLVERQTSLHH